MGGAHKCLVCSKTKKDGVSLHNIPKNKKDDWLHWLQVKDPVGQNARVCSTHFRLIIKYILYGVE